MESNALEKFTNKSIALRFFYKNCFYDLTDNQNSRSCELIFTDNRFDFSKNILSLCLDTIDE